MFTVEAGPNPIEIASKEGEHSPDGEFLPFYIPRLYMPQVDEKDLPSLTFALLNKFGSVKEGILDYRKLRAHQRVDRDRVNLMPPALLQKPILVSSDHFVIDGNHRWHAHVARHLYDGKAIIIDLPFAKALTWLDTQSYVYQITPGSPIRN